MGYCRHYGRGVIMKITVSGIVGSGKTTISKMISERLELERHYVGGMMRDMAAERGKTLQELTEDAKTDKSIDLELDRRQRDLNDGDVKFVVDSRLGFYFIPDSYKVFLRVDLPEAARRIYGANRGEEKYSNEEECLMYLKKRIDSESIRYKKYYGINFPNDEDFDLVVDTTGRGVEEIVEEILSSIPDESRDENKC